MTGYVEEGFGAVFCFYYFSDVVGCFFVFCYSELGSYQATYHAAEKAVGFYDVVQLITFLLPVRLLDLANESLCLRIALGKAFKMVIFFYYCRGGIK